MANTNKYSSWMFLGAALLAGAAAFWFSHLYLKNQEEKLREKVEGSNQGTVEVVVSKDKLQAGSIVSGATMAIGRLPKAHVTARFVTAAGFGAVQGHALVRDKASGEPLLVDDVGGGVVERFSDLLKPGERAVTLEATELNSDSGLLLPGDHIDMFLVSKQQGGAEESKSLLPLLEDVHVLAAGEEALHAQDQKYQTLNERNSHYSTITVAVSIDDAEKLVLARKDGDLAYLLRNSTDKAHNVETALSFPPAGGGAPAKAGTGGTVVDTYEYFSADQPTGVVKPIAVTAAPSGAGAVSMDLPGGTPFNSNGAMDAAISAAAKELAKQMPLAADAMAKTAGPTPAAIGAPAGSSAGTTKKPGGE